MKTLNVPAQAADVNSLLDQARGEDLLVRTSDGTEFIVTAIDEFDEEIVRAAKREAHGAP